MASGPRRQDISIPIGNDVGIIVTMNPIPIGGITGWALSATFKDTFDEVIKAGGKKQEATVKALEAFDVAMKENARSSSTFAKVQAEAADRLKKDPTTQLRAAMAKMQIAFSQPEMIKAITSLTGSLPGLAAEVARIVRFIADKPLQAALIALAARITLAAAGPAVGGAVGAGARAVGAGLAGASAAGTAAGVGGAGVAAGGAGVGAAAVAGAGLLAAGAAGGAVGFLGFKALIEPQIEEEFAGLGVKAEEVLGRAFTATGAAVSEERKRAVIAEIRKQKTSLEEEGSLFGDAVSGLASTFADVKSVSEIREEKLSKLSEAEAKLASQLDGSVTPALDRLRIAASGAGAAVGGQAGSPPGVSGATGGGPRGPGTAPNPMPGATPTGA